MQTSDMGWKKGKSGKEQGKEKKKQRKGKLMKKKSLDTVTIIIIIQFSVRHTFRWGLPMIEGFLSRNQLKEINSVVWFHAPSITVDNLIITLTVSIRLKTSRFNRSLYKKSLYNQALAKGLEARAWKGLGKGLEARAWKGLAARLATKPLLKAWKGLAARGSCNQALAKGLERACFKRL